MRVAVIVVWRPKHFPSWQGRGKTATRQDTRSPRHRARGGALYGCPYRVAASAGLGHRAHPRDGARRRSRDGRRRGLPVDDGLLCAACPQPGPVVQGPGRRRHRRRALSDTSPRVLRERRSDGRCRRSRTGHATTDRGSARGKTRAVVSRGWLSRFSAPFRLRDTTWSRRTSSFRWHTRRRAAAHSPVRFASFLPGVRPTGGGPSSMSSATFNRCLPVGPGRSARWSTSWTTISAPTAGISRTCARR